MLRNVISYAVLSLVLVGAAWLAGRLIGSGQFRRGAAGGRPELDAEYDFDRVWARHLWEQRLMVLRGRRQGLDLPLLEEAVPIHRLGRRYVGERVIPLDRVTGSVDGAAQHFDRNFRPATLRARNRLERVLAARRAGTVLPPIEVYQLDGHYYVYDGHHRVAAARALEEDYIAARVTEVLPGRSTTPA